TEAEYPSTYHRWRRADAELRRRAGHWDATALAALLADHDGYPERSLCRHGTGRDGARTAYSVIVDIDTLTTTALIGNPCQRLRTDRDGTARRRGGPGVLVLPAPQGGRERCPPGHTAASQPRERLPGPGGSLTASHPEYAIRAACMIDPATGDVLPDAWMHLR